jgi:hypothetical protein
MGQKEKQKMANLAMRQQASILWLQIKRGDTSPSRKHWQGCSTQQWTALTAENSVGMGMSVG